MTEETITLNICTKYAIGHFCTSISFFTCNVSKIPKYLSIAIPLSHPNFTSVCCTRLHNCNNVARFKGNCYTSISMQSNLNLHFANFTLPNTLYSFLQYVINKDYKIDVKFAF